MSQRTKQLINFSLQDLIRVQQYFPIGASLVGEEISPYKKFSSIHAFGAINSISAKVGHSLDLLEEYLSNTNDYVFGCLSYDVKNELEDLSSNNPTRLNTPDVLFFVPKFVVVSEGNQFYLLTHSESDAEEFLKLFEHTKKNNKHTKPKQFIDLKPRMSKREYFLGFEQIKHHIHMGDFYEMNFCQEFYQEDIDLDPLSVFQKIMYKARAPFMSYLHTDQFHLVSASPERYIQKNGSKIISQPIKGTAKRSFNAEIDLKNKSSLKSSIKERTENVMIVDLVRNDFSKICKVDSVHVPELQEVYSYPTVHQLISTIEGELQENISFTDILKATYPMGSMTGAPKLRVMQITEEVEQFKRGWYSGTVGYIEPNGDFDFNVIIRSLIYDDEQQYLSYGVGGGITYLATAEEEYEECLLKLNSLINLLND